MSLKWIWLWFYSFNQTSSYFFLSWRKRTEVFFFQWALLKLLHLFQWELEPGTPQLQQGQCRLVEVNTRKKCAWLMTVCSVSCCVLSSKEGNLSQLQLERLPFQLRPQSFKHWKVKTSHEEKWEEQRLQVSLSFWLSGKDPAVISSWSLACLSQCPPNAPSCQQAC